MPTRIRYFDLAMIPMYFGFTTDSKAFDLEMRRLGVEAPPPFVGATPATTHTIINKKTGKTVCIVCLDTSRLKGNRNSMLALLVHEAVHVWQSALEAMGAETPHGEFEAYTIQYLSQLMFDQVSKK